MTLKEIRRYYGVTREQVAMMNGCTQMVVRRIENKPLTELTFDDLDFYVCATDLTLDSILGMLLGVELSAMELKGALWCFNFNQTLNVSKTYLSLSKCSNVCSIATLQKYARAKDTFKHIKLNWCYYKLTGRELENE